MKTISTVFLFFLWMLTLNAQTITCNPVDKQLFKNKIEELKTLEAKSFGDSLIQIGKSFLGTPYVEKTLEVGDTETLVVNLSGLDCTTFVENVLAFSHLLRDEKTDFKNFTENLKTIRYRDGQLNGYPSRLHYFTEWIRNNCKKGLVKSITADLGGIIVNKPINFMGTHRNLYPFLADDKNYEAILEVEANLAKDTLCVLPQDQIASQEKNIHNGDIIALAASIKGLDVTHTGFAIKIKGRLHLLHASSSGEVTITTESLVDYLEKIKNNTGIIIARPL